MAKVTKKKNVENLDYEVVDSKSKRSNVEEKGEAIKPNISSVEPLDLPHDELVLLNEKAHNMSVDEVLRLGSKENARISSNADKLLKGVRTNSVSDSVTDNIVSLTTELNKIDKAFKPTFKDKILSVVPFGKKVNNKLSVIWSKYDDINSNVENVVRSLKDSQVMLSKDEVALSAMNESNVEIKESLEESIKLIKIKKKQLEEDIERLRLEGAEIHLINEVQMNINLIDKNLNDNMIKLAMVSSNIIEVNIIREANLVQIQNVNNFLENMIPLYKQNVAILVSINRTAESTKKMKIANESFSNMMKKKSKEIQSTLIDVAKQSTEPMVDVAVIEETFKDLRNTIDGVRKVVEDSSAKRAIANQKIEQSIEEMEKGSKKLSVFE